jgi:acyl carrier protein
MTIGQIRDETATAFEEKVATIWAEVIGSPDGRGTTFFELRGDSMSAIRLVSRIEDELGIQLEVADIFDDDPDSAAFVQHVVAKAGGAGDRPATD